METRSPTEVFLMNAKSVLENLGPRREFFPMSPKVPTAFSVNALTLNHSSRWRTRDSDGVSSVFSYGTRRIVDSAEDGVGEPCLPSNNSRELPSVQQPIGKIVDREVRNLVISIDFENLAQVIHRRTVIEATAAGAAICVLRAPGALRVGGKIIQRS